MPRFLFSLFLYVRLLLQEQIFDIHNYFFAEQDHHPRFEPGSELPPRLDLADYRDV